MLLHFAYGSNMSRSLMGMRCPDACAIGTTVLRGWRFIISPDGFASLVRQPGGLVHGVVWRLSPRDVAAVNAYENVQSSLYVRRVVPVPLDFSAPALVYIARRQGTGTARPGYIRQVVEAARDWGLPQLYIRSLARWSPSRWGGVRARDVGEARCKAQ
jgi:gamma-glutamylcyclotransferase (GGCT)/AIG2-like uncharacterized protein YtfP